MDLEQNIYTDQNAGKKLDAIEFRLQSLKGDFERQAKALLDQIPANKKGEQNTVNTRSKKVKPVKVSEMNAALDQMRKLTNGKAPPVSDASVNGSNASLQEIKTLFAQTNQKIKNVGSQIGV
jgi:hypothetical protein